MAKPKVLLCIPPDYSCDFPPLATPALTSFLRSHGVDARQLDLNILYRDFLIRKIKPQSPLSINDSRSLLSAVLQNHFGGDRFKHSPYFDLLSVDKHNFLPYLPYNNNRNSSFFFTERLLSSPLLWRYLEDSVENSFLEFFAQERIASTIVDEKFDLVGFSVTSPSQVIPTLTLGFLIKRLSPTTHIVIGGQWPTLFKNELAARPDFSRCFDGIVFGDGETAVLSLSEAISTKKSLVSIPNLIFWNGARFTVSQASHEEDLKALPPPDFDGLILGKYNSHEARGTTLTYETSRGCYWNKCIYCVDLPLPKTGYRVKTAEQIARDTITLKEKFKARSLILSDPALSPKLMTDLSGAILGNDLKIGWWSMARLDKAFSEEIFRTARRSGCRQLNFGFEAASDRVCRVAQKGNALATSLEVIKMAHNAGIAVCLQTMMGLPTETEQELFDTLEFLTRNRRYIDEVSINVYYLTPRNEIQQNPAKFGIDIKSDRTLPFQFFIPFKNSGVSSRTAQKFANLYHTMISDGKTPKLPATRHSGTFELCGMTSHFEL